MSFKEKLMDKMMDKQFSNMSSEDKQKMMESMMQKFMAGMTDEERKDIMSNMMPKVMGQMMGIGEGNPMMGMMSMMMGGNKKEGKRIMPWDGCMEMMTSLRETASSAKFATPELRSLFTEWFEQIEKEVLDEIKKNGVIDLTALTNHFSLSEESIKYILSQLASKNLIDYKV